MQYKQASTDQRLNLPNYRYKNDKMGSSQQVVMYGNPICGMF